MLKDEYLWSEKYRPHKISDVILPDDVKAVFQSFVDSGNIPNLVLSGKPGVGKTTVAQALLEELGCDYIKINGSMDRNIDTLRNEISQFASSVSFSGGRKYVILDEADYLNPQSFQPALRAFMDEFSKNTGFIFTCNYKNKIIEPLRDSRSVVIDFTFSKKDKPALMVAFYKRLIQILNENSITYDKDVLIEVIKRYYPDFRGILNKLQTYSNTGAITSGILSNIDDDAIKQLISMMKDKQFSSIRKWVVENSDNTTDVIRKLYDVSKDLMAIESQASLVLILGETQFRSAFSLDQEIVLMACFVRIMGECDFL